MTRYVRQSSGLVREFRWWDVFFITIAAPTGSGILFYSVQTTGQPGGSIVLAFAIGMLLFLPMVLASSVLAAAMPRSGGPYVAVSRLVHPAIGYLAACFLILADGIIIGILGFILMEIGGAMLAVVGQVAEVPRLQSLGEALGTEPWAPLGAVFWVVIFWIIMLRPPTIFRRILATLLLLPLVTTVVCLGIFFLTSSDQAATAFGEVWGPDSWIQIQQAAVAEGWTTPAFSWSSTFGLLLIVVWAFNGIEFSSYVGGEVQAPQRSYFKGLILGWFAVGALYMITAMAVNHSFGDIISPYHYLQANHPEKLTEIMPAITPSIPFYLMCLLSSPLLGVFLAVAFVFWFAKIIPTIFLISSRLMFALAMERLLPEKLAEVDDRTAVPTWATHATAIIGLFGAGFYYFKIGTILGTLMFGTMFVVWAMGIALIVLSLKHPELVRTKWLISPRILALPPLAWVGVVTFLSGLILLFVAGREVPRNAWWGVIALVAILLGNYYARTAAAKTGGPAEAEAPFLPPE